jgi:hypothetical protein
MRSRFSPCAALSVSLLLLGSGCSGKSPQGAVVEAAANQAESSLTQPQTRAPAPPEDQTPPDTEAETPPELSGEPLRYSIFPFGAFNIEKETYGDFFTSTIRAAQPGRITETLRLARERGARLIVSFASDNKDHYQNGDGTFNLDMWKDRVDRFASVDLDPFIADGTIVAHYLVDEPKAERRWGGVEIPDEVLDEMARYSRQYWPEMLTTVRAQATPHLEASGWNWQWLDAAWAQYSSRKGPVETYAAEQIEAAGALGLGLIMGMNPINGGNGTSGIPGRDSGKWMMSAEEVVHYGMTLMEDPQVCAFMMWRYYPDNEFHYYEIPEIAAAMDSLRHFASRRDAPPCAFH